MMRPRTDENGIATHGQQVTLSTVPWYLLVPWYLRYLLRYRSTSTVGTYGTVGTVLAGTVVLAGTWYRGTTVLVLRYLLVARVP